MSKINKNQKNVDLTLSTVKQFSSTSTTMRAFEQSCHHNNHPICSQPRTHARTHRNTLENSLLFVVVSARPHNTERARSRHRERDKRSERQITEEDKREIERVQLRNSDQYNIEHRPTPYQASSPVTPPSCLPLFTALI